MNPLSYGACGVNQTQDKDNKGNLPSPVFGLDVAGWLNYSQMNERVLEAFLQRKDLSPGQQRKIEYLLSNLRTEVRHHLEKLNIA